MPLWQSHKNGINISSFFILQGVPKHPFQKSNSTVSSSEFPEVVFLIFVPPNVSRCCARDCLCAFSLRSCPSVLNYGGAAFPRPPCQWASSYFLQMWENGRWLEDGSVFAIASKTIYHKLTGLKQHSFVISPYMSIVQWAQPSSLLRVSQGQDQSVGQPGLFYGERFYFQTHSACWQNSVS